MMMVCAVIKFTKSLHLSKACFKDMIKDGSFEEKEFPVAIYWLKA